MSGLSVFGAFIGGALVLGCCVDDEAIVPVDGSPLARSADACPIAGVFDWSFEEVVYAGGVFGGDT